MSDRGSPGGAHNHPPPLPIEEATRREIERRSEARQDPDSYVSREDARVKAAIEKARAAKARKMARDPYWRG